MQGNFVLNVKGSSMIIMRINNAGFCGLDVFGIHCILISYIKLVSLLVQMFSIRHLFCNIKEEFLGREKLLNFHSIKNTLIGCLNPISVSECTA